MTDVLLSTAAHSDGTTQRLHQELLSLLGHHILLGPWDSELTTLYSYVREKDYKLIKCAYQTEEGTSSLVPEQLCRVKLKQVDGLQLPHDICHCGHTADLHRGKAYSENKPRSRVENSLEYQTLIFPLTMLGALPADSGTPRCHQ